MKKKENFDKHMDEIAIGSAMMLILLLLMGMHGFYTWIAEELLITIASMFFMYPVIETIVERELPREWIVFILFGIGFLVAYMFVFKLTPMQVLVQMLQTLILITVLEVFIRYSHRFLKKNIPP